MDIQLLPKIHESILQLIGRISILEANQDNLKELIDSKINPSQKEFISENELANLGISKHMAYKLVQSGRLHKYKLGGKGSTSMYRYSQVMEMIAEGLVYPSKKSKT